MLAESHVIIDLTIVVAGGLVGALAARVLRLSPLVGYLSVGIVLGPSGFRAISDSEIIRTMADFGITLLLFTIGVELSLRWIWRMRSAALISAPAQIIVTVGLGYAVGHAMGLDPNQALVLGFVLALSSTMVVVKLLSSRGELHTRRGQIMIAILLVQDLAAVVMVGALLVLSGRAGGGLSGALVMGGKGIAFIIWVLILARWVVPFVMRIVARSYSREIFVAVAAALCLGGAVSGHLLGFSIALGAFAAGLVISESEYSHQLLADVTPLRDLFAMVFFVSLGLLLDVRAALIHLDLALVLLLAVFVGKPLIAATAALLGRYHARNAIATGLGLAQIGEFSFLVATLAWRHDLITKDLHSLVIAVAGVSLLATPALMRLGDLVYVRLRTWRPAADLFDRQELPTGKTGAEGLVDHVIVCGYGRVGRTVGETLTRRKRPIVVIDYDQHVAAELRSREVPILYGDASSRLLLAAAGAERARAAVLALPDARTTRLAVRELRAINPTLPIVARVHLSEEVDAIYREGATEVVYAEFEASLEIIRHVLLCLGHEPKPVQSLVDEVRGSGYRSLTQDGEEQRGDLPR